MVRKVNFRGWTGKEEGEKEAMGEEEEGWDGFRCCKRKAGRMHV